MTTVSVPVSAATLPGYLKDTPYADTYTSLVSTRYMIIACEYGGYYNAPLNKNVKLTMLYSPSSNATRIDVRMLDKYGQPVWEQLGAISPYGSKTFWAGSNVYTIQIRAFGIATNTLAKVRMQKI